MTIWQLLNQLRYLLRAKTWPTGEVLFAPSSVICTEGGEEKAIAEMIPPLALLSGGSSLGDPDSGENPSVRKTTLKVLLLVCNENDRLGEAALMGAARAEDSPGRGILEIEELLNATIEQLTAQSGVKVGFVASSDSDARFLPNRGYAIAKEHVFDAWVSTRRSYQPVTQLTAAVVAGTVTLAWKFPWAQWSARRAIVRRVAGSVAPTGPTNGTDVPLAGTPAGAGALGATDTPGAGTWSYGVWIAYDEYESGTDESYSGGVTKTAVAVS